MELPRSLRRGEVRLQFWGFCRSSFLHSQGENFSGVPNRTGQSKCGEGRFSTEVGTHGDRRTLHRHRKIAPPSFLNSLRGPGMFSGKGLAAEGLQFWSLLGHAWFGVSHPALQQKASVRLNLLSAGSNRRRHPSIVRQSSPQHA